MPRKKRAPKGKAPKVTEKQSPEEETEPAKPIIAVGQKFDSFDEFRVKVEEHGALNMVQWVKSDSKTVQSTNKALSSTSKLYDERFVFRYVRYRCKHGGKVKPFKKVAAASRPNQKTFKMQCPAQIYASVDRNINKVVIRIVDEKHNHRLGEDVFMRYPEQRRLDAEMLTSVKEMLSMKVKVKDLQGFVHSKGKMLAARDIHNIRRRMMKETVDKKVEKDLGEKIEEGLLMEALSEIGEEDPGATVSIQVANEEIQFLTIVTTEMKCFFNLYPEVLMVDCTHRVNELRKPLYVFMVEDREGQGRVIGFSFVYNEKNYTIESLLSEMSKTHHLEQASTVIIVDKDCSELSAVRKVLPEVDIQLSKFHVLQAVQREVQKEAIAQADRNVIITAVQKMAYCRSEEDYSKYYNRLESISPVQFMDYFNENWDNCKELWAGFKTNCYVNLGSTNTQLDSLSKKIKDVLHRNTTLHEAVKGMMLLLHSMVHSANHTTFKNTHRCAYRFNEKSMTIKDASCQLTRYACQIVSKEIKSARKNHKLLVKTSQDRCCSLKLTMGLPCRHVFAVQIENQQDPFFVLDDVQPRWRRDYERSAGACKRKTDDDGVSFKRVKNVEVSPKSKDVKYSTMMSLFKSMAEIASNDSKSDFVIKLSAVQKMREAWLNGHGKSVVDPTQIEDDDIIDPPTEDLDTELQEENNHIEPHVDIVMPQEEGEDTELQAETVNIVEPQEEEEDTEPQAEEEEDTEPRGEEEENTDPQGEKEEDTEPQEETRYSGAARGEGRY